MSTFKDDDSHHEIIIVKRGGSDHDDGHHGGVWKIAFADFMTAMMCFFLVMWLINATDEQTKASMASYFNPMTLIEPTPAGSGVDDPGVSPRSQNATEAEQQKAAEERPKNINQAAGPAQHANSVESAEVEKTSDAHLFADPYAVLAEIVAETGKLQNISSKGDGGAQQSGPSTGAHGGESYRDPFAPDFWSQEIANPEATELEIFKEDLASAGEWAESQQEPSPNEQAEAALVAAATTDQPLPEPAEPAEAIEVEEAEEPETQNVAEEIRQDLAAAFGQDEALNRTLSVSATSDGVLISVTDELNYGMFEIGSAVPQRQLVLAMEKIGETLKAQPGKIRINGHTDGRPFLGNNYDNWRLSSARAQAAYYMLVRAGLDEQRVKSVAGFADRELKIPDEPNADANRRIEIFLETSG